MKISEFFENKTILICGGTGSIGSEIVRQILQYNPYSIRILSNSENELWKTEQSFKEDKDKLRFLVGDVRNAERMERATYGCDYVFNAAAIKHVSIGEYNPLETVLVNFHGLENIIQASFKNKVKKLVHISTDKAVNPTTVMGASKMLGERLCLSRGLLLSHTSICCVRFGNVLGTRGSIVPLIKEQIKKENEVTITDTRMRRFFISTNQAVELVIKASLKSRGGEIFVLKMPTIRVEDLIDVFIEEYSPLIGKDPSSIKKTIIGPHFGEKINEELISHIEFDSCYEMEDMYVIDPLVYYRRRESSEIANNGKVRIKPDQNFHYNTKYETPLSKEEIRDLLHNLKLL